MTSSVHFCSFFGRHRPYAFLAIFLCIVLNFFGGASLLHASESNNYQIPSDVQGAGGGEESRSTNYILSDTIGEGGIGFGRSANYDLDAGYRQTLESFLSLAAPAAVDIGTIIESGQNTASGTWTVITDAEAGYSLTWRASTANMTSGGDAISAFTPTTADEPDTWSMAATDAEWGGRLSSTSTDTAAEWGVDDSSEKWLNISATDRTIVTRSSRTSVQGSKEIIYFRVEVGTSKIQPTGTYNVTVVITASSL